VESDPIGLFGGANTFGYVNGSPLGKVDRDGLMAAVLAAPAVVACGPVCWTTIALVGAAAIIVAQCTNNDDKKAPPVSNERKEKCRQAFLRCLNDKSIPESECFKHYSNCISHEQPYIGFPGKGNGPIR